MQLFRTNTSSLDTGIERIIDPFTGSLQLLCLLNGAQILCGMINLTFYQVEGIVEIKQRSIAPVSEEATIGERKSLYTPTLDEVILTIVEEVALIELHSHTTPKLHDTICTIVYVGVGHTKIGSLHQVKTIGTTTVEVAILYKILSSTLYTDHTTRAVASLGMSDSQVMYLTMVAVDEVETIGITGINLDA